MAARIGQDPSMLVNHPLKTQLLAMGLGGVGAALTEDQGAGVRTAATIAPILLVQALRRRELKNIQKDYDNKKRKRLRDIDDEELFDAGLFGGSSRLGAVNAYETMRKRKYKGFGSLAEAGDAIQLAAGAISPALYYGTIPLLSGIDNGEADRMLNKRADFSEQRNNPALPLYLAAAAAAAGGSAIAGGLAHRELFNTDPLPQKDWGNVIRSVSGVSPVTYSAPGLNNAHFYKPQTERDALAYMRIANRNRWQSLTPKQEDIAKMISPHKQMRRLLQYGVITADANSGAPTIAHEAGHAKIEQTPGILRALQRHVYPHSKWIAPMSGAGSMAAGLASGSTLGGALLGTGIGALSGIGTLGPEVGASWHARKGLAGGPHNAETTRDLVSALSTYLAGSVLPSTLAGAAGGYISGRRKKKEEEDREKSASTAGAAHLIKLWNALRPGRRMWREGYYDIADSHMMERVGSVYKAGRNMFYNDPKIKELGILESMKSAEINKLMKAFSPPPAANPTVQGTFDFLGDIGKSINKSAADSVWDGAATGALVGGGLPAASLADYETRILPEQKLLIERLVNKAKAEKKIWVNPSGSRENAHPLKSRMRLGDIILQSHKGEPIKSLKFLKSPDFTTLSLGSSGGFIPHAGVSTRTGRIIDPGKFDYKTPTRGVIDRLVSLFKGKDYSGPKFSELMNPVRKTMKPGESVNKFLSRVGYDPFDARGVASEAGIVMRGKNIANASPSAIAKVIAREQQMPYGEGRAILAGAKRLFLPFSDKLGLSYARTPDVTCNGTYCSDGANRVMRLLGMPTRGDSSVLPADIAARKDLKLVGIGLNRAALESTKGTNLRGIDRAALAAKNQFKSVLSQGASARRILGGAAIGLGTLGGGLLGLGADAASNKAE